MQLLFWSTMIVLPSSSCASSGILVLCSVVAHRYTSSVCSALAAMNLSDIKGHYIYLCNTEKKHVFFVDCNILRFSLFLEKYYNVKIISEIGFNNCEEDNWKKPFRKTIIWKNPFHILITGGGCQSNKKRKKFRFPLKFSVDREQQAFSNYKFRSGANGSMLVIVNKQFQHCND